MVAIQTGEREIGGRSAMRTPLLVRAISVIRRFSDSCRTNGQVPPQQRLPPVRRTLSTPSSVKTAVSSAISLKGQNGITRQPGVIILRHNTYTEDCSGPSRTGAGCGADVPAGRISGTSVSGVWSIICRGRGPFPIAVGIGWGAPRPTPRLPGVPRVSRSGGDLFHPSMATYRPRRGLGSMSAPAIINTMLSPMPISPYRCKIDSSMIPKSFSARSRISAIFSAPCPRNARR